MVPSVQYYESLPSFRREVFARKTLTASGTANDEIRIADDFLWLGIASVNSAHANYSLSFYLENGSDYIPVRNNAVRSAVLCGTAQRPFMFPAPRLLRRGTHVKEYLTEQSGVGTDVTIILLGLVVKPEVADLWDFADLGYTCIANAGVDVTISASSPSLQKLELVKAWDFGALSLTGLCSNGTLVDLVIKDPMGCPRDPGVMTTYDIESQAAPFDGLVGSAQYPAYFLGPYVFLADGHIAVSYTNRHTSPITTSLAVHGCKIPRANPEAAKRAIEWLNRTAIRMAR